jgi:FkbM family methyltransferase
VRAIELALVHAKSKIESLMGLNSAHIPKEFLTKILRDENNPRIIDVGCNRGEFSHQCFNINPSSQICAFDLHEDLSEFFSAKFNGFDFTFQNVVVSSCEGDVSVVINREFDRKAHIATESEKSKAITMKQATLDSLIKFEGKIKILKIDTEGSDFDVLTGATGVLERTDFVIFEVMFRLLINGHTPSETIEFLKSKGFSYFYRTTKYLGLIEIEGIPPWEVETQNIVASRFQIQKEHRG